MEYSIFCSDIIFIINFVLYNFLSFFLHPRHVHFLFNFLFPLLPEVTQDRSGRGYQNTPLGALLSISCLPKHPAGQFEFFEKPSSQPNHTHKDTENSIWIAQNTINARLHKIFYSLLKVILTWFSLVNV